MSCGCPKIERTGLWTPNPSFNRPSSDIQFGENIDCYMKRSSGGVYAEQNVLGPKPPDRIENTSLTTDSEANVREQLRLTPESTRTATNWTATVGGQSIETAIPGVVFNASTGNISGQVAESHRGKNYAVLVTAYDGTGPIDAREFNFYPKDGSKEDTLRFVLPLVGTGARITSDFGLRTAPARGASKEHKGIDMSCTEGLGDVVASADGIVRRVGPANGFGNWVHIDHHDSSGKLVATTLYAHMHRNEIYVTVGQRVSAGQKIAKEGNAGIGSGAHLHFELHRGGYKNPVDPVPYFSGEGIQVPTNTSSEMSPEGTATPTGFRPRDHETPGLERPAAPGMTAGESNTAPCASNPNSPTPENLPPGLTNPEGVDPSQPSGIDEAAAAESDTQAEGNDIEEAPAENVSELPETEQKNPCIGTTGKLYSPSVIRSIIEEECAAAGLDSEDATLLKNIARIESTYNPYATNPRSSATGLFQMLNETAKQNYAAIGIPEPTCEQRCDPRLAVKAQIEWYKREWLKYWTNFISSGKTTINGPIKPTAHSGSSAPFYAGLSKSEFLYGLIHHDGVGNATNGVDAGGVAYWRRRMQS